MAAGIWQAGYALELLAVCHDLGQVRVKPGFHPNVIGDMHLIQGMLDHLVQAGGYEIRVIHVGKLGKLGDDPVAVLDLLLD